MVLKCDEKRKRMRVREGGLVRVSRSVVEYLGFVGCECEVEVRFVKGRLELRILNVYC